MCRVCHHAIIEPHTPVHMSSPSSTTVETPQKKQYAMPRRCYHRGAPNIILGSSLEYWLYNHAYFVL